VKRRRRTGARVAAVVGAIAVAAMGSALAARRTTFTVSSTLSERQVLPHRIHWLGRPSLPPSDIREVAFLIDGRRAWVEHHAPYSYGYDGNYLVTSWMKPGVHTFTVAAVATNGRRATISSRARTLSPEAPPAALAGPWHRRLSATETRGSGRAGIWTLTVSSLGWRILDPTRGRGALVDVAYVSSHTLEARGGIATRDHDPRENNPWCDEPFQPVRYHWHVAAARLTLTLAGPRRCDGQARVWAGSWTRR
jgi:hypothetical protein